MEERVKAARRAVQKREMGGHVVHLDNLRLSRTYASGLGQRAVFHVFPV